MKNNQWKLLLKNYHWHLFICQKVTRKLHWGEQWDKISWALSVVYFKISEGHRVVEQKHGGSGLSLKKLVHTLDSGTFILSTPHRIEKSLSPQKFHVSIVPTLIFLPLHPCICGSVFPFLSGSASRHCPSQPGLEKRRLANTWTMGFRVGWLPTSMPVPKGCVFAPHFLGSHP